ncbi:WYL domain-containing protein [Nodosilinea sp. P-1105]|uniref:helix-turn-helix transcriptional regulator n=1 Tax=Nodosilinea sp. P-1105 TaxID=2546229 RepID=UPI00146E77EE|nr:WYL domain-containing protein [Nodosilinea sp. P-1105]NMF81786.1 WYL domain-containing protein [Nodosilinea sp. P-1105]
MTRQKRSITLSIDEAEKAQLEQLALDFDQTWGDRPNVSKLIKAIAQGTLRLAVNHDWSPERIKALNLARGQLHDQGYGAEALAIANLLLERSELSHPLRQDIQAFVDYPAPPWRADIDRCLRRQRPFRLTYQDAAGLLWSFSVRHAKIAAIEERQYLVCWCDETDGNQDISQLQHNWTLRLDRIPEEAVISPIDGPWQPELAFVDVEMHLLGRLALAYRTKSKVDRVNEWDAERQVRRVVRRITSTFWFFREVRRYGADCVIVEPEDIRQRFVSELRVLVDRYGGGSE